MCAVTRVNINRLSVLQMMTVMRILVSSTDATNPRSLRYTGECPQLGTMRCFLALNGAGSYRPTGTTPEYSTCQLAFACRPGPGSVLCTVLLSLHGHKGDEKTSSCLLGFDHALVPWLAKGGTPFGPSRDC